METPQEAKQLPKCKKCSREVDEASRLFCLRCRTKSNARTARHRARAALGKNESLCSVSTCQNPRTPPNKKCDACLAYMRQYKVAYRAVPKTEGTCTGTDCDRLVKDSAYKHCLRCRERTRAAQAASETYLPQHKALRDRVRVEVFAHYGPSCRCCGESRAPFLQIDHINGTGHAHVDKAGRRIAGPQLYAQLKRAGFPEGYRVLCCNCNGALGHQGYCPHGDLTQDSKRGRPTLRTLDPVQQAKKRAYWITYKTEVLSHYGNGCACCGETRHEFLSIEHPGQTGAAHRKEITGSSADGRNFLVWLRKNRYPPGYAVLCMNCNFATRRGDNCPHAVADI